MFTKPEYILDEDCDNMELRDIVENARLMYNNKSPKKENRQPTNSVTYKQAEKSKRGSYNFIQNQPANGVANNSTFITRSDMQKVPEKRRKKSLEEKNMVWTSPK